MQPRDPNNFSHPHYYSSFYYNKNQKTPIEPKPPKKHRGMKLFLLIILIILIGIIVNDFSAKSKAGTNVAHAIVSIVKKSPKTSTNTDSISAASLDNMSQTINSIISQNSGINMSVNLIDLSNDQTEHYGVDQTFQAASTAKIITAEYFLHQVEQGSESLTETINGSSAEYELQQMIVVSDDNAWAALDNKLGYNNLQNYADTSLGISDYQAYNNSLSSTDIALALKGLWQGKLLNSTDTQLLLSYLKIANYREYIVPAVPSDDIIYHKIGLYQDYVNDAAIISHGDQAFVIVIFTNGNGTYNWPERAATMQQITKAALKAYFNQ
jgi:beta-lactamase class A